MGLDIYINKKKEVGYDRDNREHTVKIKEVLYLRKANQIHKYFVDNFADGVDECQEIDIDIEGIKRLKNTCERIIRESKLEERWQLYEHTGSRRVPKDQTIALAEKVGDHFVKVGGVAPSDIKVGDYLYEAETHASKVAEIEEGDDEFRLGYDLEMRKKVIINSDLAETELPTQAGFFFGDTNYNEDYLEDLKEYVRQAGEIIADYEQEIKSGTDKFDIDYVYQASW